MFRPHEAHRPARVVYGCSRREPVPRRLLKNQMRGAGRFGSFGSVLGAAHSAKPPLAVSRQRSGNGVGNIQCLPFFQSAVGNAQWSGTRLADVLRSAGIQDRAVEVVFYGADQGQDVANRGAPYKVAPYSFEAMEHRWVRPTPRYRLHLSPIVLSPTWPHNWCVNDGHLRQRFIAARRRHNAERRER